MEIKVGDYVRYKDIFGNEIIKIRKLNKIIPPDELIEENYYYFNDKEGTIQENIIKSSPNIMDLIEVGDYVNGYLVKDIDYAFDDVIMNKKNARYVPYIDCNKNNYIDDIKSIVTKEQFESMKYIVGE